MSYEGWILLTASLVGLSCGLIGVFLILRKMAMMADAISHTVLLGIVTAYLITRELSGMSMLIGAIIAGLLTAVLVQLLHSLGVQQDASIGVVFTTLFAIGVILISTKTGNVHLDVQHALMGEITFVPWHTMDVPLIGEIPQATFLLLIVLAIVLIMIVAFYKEWKITTFDAALAASLGIPVMLMHYVFMTLVSITTVASFDAVGAIMVVAMLITPAAAAYLVDRSTVRHVMPKCPLRCRIRNRRLLYCRLDRHIHIRVHGICNRNHIFNQLHRISKSRIPCTIYSASDNSRLRQK